MEELRRASLAYELRSGGRLMVEYVVLPGINDSFAELDALSKWMVGLRGVVNLIPFNPFPGTEFAAPTDAQVRAAYDRLQQNKTPVTVRWPRGRDVDGACGQLMLQEGRDAS